MYGTPLGMRCIWHKLAANMRKLVKIAEMRTNGMSLILVSHSRDQVNKFCDHFVRLEHGKEIESGVIKKTNPSDKQQPVNVPSVMTAVS